MTKNFSDTKTGFAIHDAEVQIFYGTESKGFGYTEMMT